MSNNDYNQADFDIYDAANPEVYKKFVEFTLFATKRRKKYSAWAIVNRIRWHTDIETTGSEFKMSNNWTAFYARKFMKDYPKHDGFFNIKPMKH